MQTKGEIDNETAQKWKQWIIEKSTKWMCVRVCVFAKCGSKEKNIRKEADH